MYFNVYLTTIRICNIYKVILKVILKIEEGTFKNI